jgi:hypothetical protein
LAQAFLKKWWVESDFKAPNLPLSLRRQLLGRGWWSSPASFTTKTGRHDIAEILLKVALNKINPFIPRMHCLKNSKA